MTSRKIYKIGVDFDKTIVMPGSSPDKILYVPSCRKYLKILFQEGHELHIITARRRTNEKVTRKLVKQIEIDLEIKFDSITFTERHKKGKFAAALDCLFLVDDHYYYVSNCLKYGVVPILIGTAKKLDIPTAKTWKQVYEFISE